MEQSGDVQLQHEAGFQLEVTPELQESEYKNRIAALTGRHGATLETSDIVEAYFAHKDALTRRFIGDTFARREIDEKVQTFFQNAEGLIDLLWRTEPERLKALMERIDPNKNIEGELLSKVEPDYMTYGLFIPDWLEGLRKYRNPSERTKPYKSLLVGAQTPQTVSEYLVTNRYIFPKADCHVLDIEGIKTRDACEAGNAQFHQGDGLNMPSDLGAFDTVQTEHLLYFLGRGLDWAGRSQTDIKLFTNAYRVLKKGGMLMLLENRLPVRYETVSDEKTRQKMIQRYQTEISDNLQGVGFSEIELDPNPMIIASRADLDKYIMMGNKWRMPQTDIRRTQDNMFVTCRK